MKKYIIILIAFHLIGSSLYATKTFLEQTHIHKHNHSHNGSNHQHKHSHSQISINTLDFFTDTQNTNLFYFSNSTQIYLETVAWIPNPIIESLFRPPKI
jgi:hypothetical protein